MESNRFMSESTSICPETTHQKLESQRLYLTLLTMNLYVMFPMKHIYMYINNCVSYVNISFVNSLSVPHN